MLWLGYVVRAWLLFLCLILASPSWAQELDRLFSASPTLPLAAPLQWQLLPKGSVPGPQVFDDLAKAQAFAVLPASIPLPTAQGKELWLRFSLPATPAPEQWYLRMPRVSVGSITLYSKNSQQEWTAQAAGEAVPVGKWPIPTRGPSFQMLTRTDQAQSYFVKIEHRMPLVERLQLIDGNSFIENASRIGVFTGLLMGVFGLLATLALVTAWLYRASQLVWFAAMVLMLLFVQLIAVGHAGLKFWPQSIYLSQIMGWVSALVMLSCVTVFCLKVSYAKQAFKKIYAASLVLVFVLMACAAIFAVQPDLIPRGALNALVIAVIVWNIAILAWMAWRSQPWLWLIALGLVPATASLFIRVAYNLGWFRHIEVALFAGAGFIAAGMMLIYARLMAHNRDGFTTRQRESGLGNTDANTGLTVAAVVNIRLPQVLMRSHRFAEPCGVLMLRWVEHDKYMRDLNYEKRGIVLSSLGARLLRLVRPIDTAARLDDDHFIFLIESPVTRHNLNDLGMRVLTACLRPTRALPDGAFYSMHVAIWVSTDHNDMQAPDVISALRNKLKRMASDGKRAVQFVDSSSSRPAGVDSLLATPESAFSTDWGAADQKQRKPAKP